MFVTESVSRERSSASRLFVEDLHTGFIFVSEPGVARNLANPIVEIVEVYVGAPVFDVTMVAATVPQIVPNFVAVIVDPVPQITKS